MKKKWNKETCYQEAKNYTTRTEFQKGSGAAYNVAWKNGWLKDYTWLEQQQKPHGYWNYEMCYEEAKKYNTRTEVLKKQNGAYESALKNGWLDDYTWFKRPKPSNYKWNKESCYEEALKYNTRNEFRKGSSGAYAAALKNEWLDNYTWLVDGRLKLHTDKIDSVYVYLFEDNAAYVGRTLMRRQDTCDKENLLDKYVGQ